MLLDPQYLLHFHYLRIYIKKHRAYKNTGYSPLQPMGRLDRQSPVNTDSHYIGIIYINNLKSKRTDLGVKHNQFTYSSKMEILWI